MKVKLYNVRDIRDGRIYSEVIVDQKKAKWFEPILKSEEESDENAEE